MYQATTTIRVRYAETDQMGYVYYGNYAMYFEVARVEALRQLGFSYKKLEEDGVIMPVMEQYTRYMKPGKYDDLLTIKTYVKEMPGIRIKFFYQVFNESNDLITEGETKLTFLTKESHKPTRPPQYLIDLMEPFFETKNQE